ncbi:hypothetical protein WME94_08105 [Sorangium sp. So ce429]
MHRATSQRMAACADESVRWLALPPPSEEVLPGVAWGKFDTLFTPAFWAGRAWLDSADGHFERYRLGDTLQEETAACLLGGHGIPAEVGLAAYDRVRASGLLLGQPSAAEFEQILAAPLLVRGRTVRYRFPRQKAKHLAGSLDALARTPELPSSDRALRDFLMRLPGIGPKTASWITRNWKGSDLVAILDVHINRACVAAGVFPEGSDPARSYFELERQFLAFAAAIGTRASVLDNLMWQTMRKIGHLAPCHQGIRPLA